MVAVRKSHFSDGDAEKVREGFFSNGRAGFRKTVFRACARYRDVPSFSVACGERKWSPSENRTFRMATLKKSGRAFSATEEQAFERRSFSTACARYRDVPSFSVACGERKWSPSENRTFRMATLKKSGRAFSATEEQAFERRSFSTACARYRDVPSFSVACGERKWSPSENRTFRMATLKKSGRAFSATD